MLKNWIEKWTLATEGTKAWNRKKDSWRVEFLFCLITIKATTPHRGAADANGRKTPRRDRLYVYCRTQAGIKPREGLDVTCRRDRVYRKIRTVLKRKHNTHNTYIRIYTSIRPFKTQKTLRLIQRVFVILFYIAAQRIMRVWPMNIELYCNIPKYSVNDIKKNGSYKCII